MEEHAIIDLHFTKYGCRKTITKYMGKQGYCRKCDKYYTPRGIAQFERRPKPPSNFKNAFYAIVTVSSRFSTKTVFLGRTTRQNAPCVTSPYKGKYQAHSSKSQPTNISSCSVSRRHVVSKTNHSSNFFFPKNSISTHSSLPSVYRLHAQSVQ